MSNMANNYKLALIQLVVGNNKAENVEKATTMIKEAALNGAHMVALPESFNCPYGVKYFPSYAESIPDGSSCLALRDAARQNGVFVIGGSIPEVDGGKIYNTMTVWCPEGHLIAKHRKMHLFDMEIPGKVTFRESDVMCAGDEPTSFSTPWGNIGLGICRDVRFTELASVYERRNCKLLVYPGAFNLTTGPVHWDLVARGRAADSQVYVALPSPARDPTADYIAWGHSCVANAWGDIIATCDEKETIVYADIDLDHLELIRTQFPVGPQRRDDVYQVVDLKADVCRQRNLQSNCTERFCYKPKA